MVTEMRGCLWADGKISVFKGGKGRRDQEGTEKEGRIIQKAISLTRQTEMGSGAPGGNIGLC